MSTRITLAQVRKAITAVIVPALVGLAAALADDHITAAEWVGIAVAALGTGGAVYLVPNATPASGATPGGTTKYDGPTR